MYEHRSEPLLSRRDYVVRVGKHVLLGLCLSFTALGLGVVGYHVVAGCAWIDALYNASMLLGGMGPVGCEGVDFGVSGKLFASFYALFAGLVFIAVAGIMVAPVAHRLLHTLHIEMDDE
jgi:hypothetical protein